MVIKNTSVEDEANEVLLDNESKYLFGNWEYDPMLAQLKCEEQSTRLQPRLAKLLSLFLANQGKLQTRDQLIDGLWGEKSVNEDALSRCVAELRSILGDKSQAPIYIETLPKKGYRLICEVGIQGKDGKHSIENEDKQDKQDKQAEEFEGIEESKPGTANEARTTNEDDKHSENHAASQSSTSQSSANNKSSAELDWLTQLNLLNKNKTFWLVFGAILLAIGIYQSFTAPSKSVNQAAQQAQRLKTSLANSERLTTDADIEFQPDISRQGDKVAYLIRDKGKLIVRIVDRHAKLLHEIRDEAHHLFSPKFSPDGRSLAIAYLDGKKCDVYLVALPSLQKTRLTSCRANINSGIFDWSQNGRYLAMVAPGKNLINGAASGVEDKSAAIWIFDTNTMVGRQITFPEVKQEFDSRPAFSTDGRVLAFTRGSRSIRNIYTVSMPNELDELTTTIPTPKALTEDNGYIVSFAWLKNGQQIIFDSNRLGDRALWMLDTRTKEQSILGARDGQYPSIDAANQWLIYKEVQYQANIWSAQLPTESDITPKAVTRAKTSATTAPILEPFISAIKYNNHPKFSPNGESVAFVSNRKGKSSLWLYSIADDTQRELLNLPGTDITTPNWSNDGRTLLVSTRGQSGYRCYRLDISTGIYRPIPTAIQTHGCSFDETGNILAVDKSPGLPSVLIAIDQADQTKQLTDYAISRAYPLGTDHVVFSKPEQDGLFRIDISSKEVETILPEFDHRMDEQWLLRDHFIYYAETVDMNNQGMWRYDLKTKQRVKLIKDTPSAIGLNLEISPDHQQVLMVKTDSKVGNIYIAKIEAAK